jgi:Fe-S-cluster containining protein
MNQEEVQQRLAKLTDLATAKQKSNKKLMQRLKKRPKEMDTLFREAHEEVFEELDCLHCANCCKTTSPIFIEKDINRLAKRFRMKPIEFIEAYLRVDEDGDYVLQSSPCVFLNEDNTCQVYEDRPRACREYPHTNRKNMHQISSLTVKNASICPAVYEILERLRLVGG